MKTGIPLNELAGQLEAQVARKRDVVLDSRMLTMLTARNDDGTGGITDLDIPDESAVMPTDLFHRQLGTHLGLRAELYDRLRRKHPGLYDHLVNGLLREAPSRQLIRMYKDGAGPDGRDGIARAFLSERYLRIDNYDLAKVALPIIGRLGADLRIDAHLGEDKMYLKVVVPGGAVDLNDYRRAVDWDALRRQYGAHHMFNDGTGPADYVQPGFLIENSEVGAGALRVSQLVFRVACSNGLIVSHAVQRRHVGTVIGGDDAGTIWRSDTVEAIDNAIRLKVRDAIAQTVDETSFALICQQFAEAGATRPIDRPVEAMKVVTRQVDLTEREGNDVLTFLLGGGDLTKFGMVNAITAMAQTVDSYERSVELESVASTVMDWNAGEWDRVAVTA